MAAPHPVVVSEVLTGSGSKNIAAVGRVRIDLWAGGGGGGGGSGNGGGGGGGGGYIRLEYMANPQDGNIQWNVGGAGSGGLARGPSQGQHSGRPGGDTTFTMGAGDFTVIAFGGQGGNNRDGGGEGGRSEILGNVTPLFVLKHNGENGHNHNGHNGGRGGLAFSPSRSDVQGDGGTGGSGLSIFEGEGNNGYGNTGAVGLIRLFYTRAP